MAMRLNVEKLVAALGGVTKAAEIAGTPRTAPYRWIKTGYVSSYTLEKFKAARPELDLNHFFEQV